MLLAILISILVVVVIVAGAYEAFHAHVRRFGFLPVLWRWFTGRQRHGLEGDDRRKDDKYDPHSKHYQAKARWLVGLRRTSWTLLIPLGAMAWISHQIWFNSYFHLTHGNRLDVTVGILAAIIIGEFLFRMRGFRSRRGNNRAIATPLHRTLAPEVGRPLATRPGQWINVSPDRSEVRADFPKNFNPPEGQKNRIVQIIRDTAGMREDAQVTWRLKGKESFVEVKSANPPPGQVSLAQVRDAIESTTQDSVVLGLGKGDEPIRVSMAQDSPHFGLSIAAGGGKSQLARFVAAQVLHNGGIVLILDIKRLSHTWARDLPNVRYARTIEEIHSALIWLDYEINRRTRVADVGVDLEGEIHANVGPRLLVIAEELNEGMARLRRYWTDTRAKNQAKKSPAIEALEEALFMGRQVRVNMFAVAQMMTALAAGSGAARENMGIRILGRYTRNAWRMLVPEHDMPPRSMKPGRIQVVTSKIQECQVAFLTGAEARELAVSGEVTPFPMDISEELDATAQRRAIPTVTGIIIDHDASDDASERTVTLTEALALCPGKTVAALRNARDRHAREPDRYHFPESVGRRGTGPKAPHVYRAKDIVRWYEGAKGHA